jgi:hypothetical protein
MVNNLDAGSVSHLALPSPLSMNVKGATSNLELVFSQKTGDLEPERD